MTMSSALRMLGWAVLLASTMGATEGGCGQGLQNRPGEPGLEVGGVAGATWQVRYGDQIEVTVKGAAGQVVARRNILWASGGSFEVGGTVVDLRALCARGDVVCPLDVLPTQVRMTQPGADRHYLRVTFNRKGPFANLTETTLLGNVDSDNDYSIFLGAGAAGNGLCGLLGVSYATGRITPDPLVPSRGSALTGDIVTGYSGGCVVGNPNGAAVAGITVELRQPLSALRL